MKIKIQERAVGRKFTVADLLHLVQMLDAACVPEEATVKARIGWGGSVKELIVEGSRDEPTPSC